MSNNILDKDIVYIPADTRGQKYIEGKGGKKKSYLGQYNIKEPSYGFVLSSEKEKKILVYNITKPSYWLLDGNDIYSKERNR